MIAAAAVIGLTNVSSAANLSKVNRGLNTGNPTQNLNGLNHKPGDSKLVNQADRLKRQQAVEAAITNGDYNAWVVAVGVNNPMLTKITKDNFPKLVEAHNLRKQADSIMTELGIEKGAGQGMGFGKNGSIK